MPNQLILPLIAGLPGGMEWLILFAFLIVPLGVLAGVFAIGYAVGKGRATREFLTQSLRQGHQPTV
jgi:hypothetical protein